MQLPLDYDDNVLWCAKQVHENAALEAAAVTCALSLKGGKVKVRQPEIPSDGAKKASCFMYFSSSITNQSASRTTFIDMIRI